jgi:hypothetical protein
MMAEAARHWVLLAGDTYRDRESHGRHRDHAGGGVPGPFPARAKNVVCGARGGT